MLCLCPIPSSIHQCSFGLTCYQIEKLEQQLKAAQQQRTSPAVLTVDTASSNNMSWVDEEGANVLLRSQAAAASTQAAMQSQGQQIYSLCSPLLRQLALLAAEWAEASVLSAGKGGCEEISGNEDSWHQVGGLNIRAVAANMFQLCC
jgi:hypothetical protein